MSKSILLFLTLGFFIVSCGEDGMEEMEEEMEIELEDINFNLNAMPYQTLSEYNFFYGEMSAFKGNKGVLPYDLITPLFTDYAIKDRFLWIPDGLSSSYVNDNEVLDFPVGTIIIKNFKYNNILPGNETKILETRLLVKKDNKWEAYSYEWNESQSEATFLQIGRSIPITWNENGQTLSTNYKIPTQEECKTCHRYKGNISPIGPKPQHMDRAYTYEDGPMNQLDKMVEIGYLQSIPSTIHSVANWEDPSESLNDRARAYLDINCSHCHNEQGSASNTSLYYGSNIDDKDLLGFCKVPISAGGDATGGHKYDIVPGNAGESILIYRLSSTEAEVAMPELGRTLNHTEGIALITEWINSLDQDDRCK